MRTIFYFFFLHAVSYRNERKKKNVDKVNIYISRETEKYQRLYNKITAAEDTFENMEIVLQ